MLRTYGRGRAEQFRETPTLGSALNFVPPLFLLYLPTLIAVWNITFVPKVRYIQDLYSLPLVLYALAVLAQAFVLIPTGGFVRSLCVMPLIVLTHVLYGYGFWRGLFTKLKSPGEPANVAVKLEITSFGGVQQAQCNTHEKSGVDQSAQDLR